MNERKRGDMRNLEIHLPEGADFAVVEQAIDAAILDSGLRVTLRGTLKRHPGCVHWHAKREREAGTLEITLWPREGRAWFTIQDGRTAAWIDEAAMRLAEAIANRLNARGESTSSRPPAMLGPLEK